MCTAVAAVFTPYFSLFSLQGRLSHQVQAMKTAHGAINSNSAVGYRNVSSNRSRGSVFQSWRVEELKQCSVTVTGSWVCGVCVPEFKSTTAISKVGKVCCCSLMY